MNTNIEKEVILYTKQDGVALITLNRPKSYNALSKALSAGIIKCIKQAEGDDEVKVIVLTGNGKAFCAGVDLKEVSSSPDGLGDDTALLNVFNHRKKPMLGAINGFCMTGGLELALSCDLLYAAENAVFADTHAKVGLMPTWGMCQRLPRLIGNGRAKEMSLSGRKIDAPTALAWGLVNRVFPLDQLLSETLQLATEITHNNQTSVMGMKGLIDKGTNLPLEEALAYEYKTSHKHNDALDLSGMMKKLNEVRGKK